MDFFFKNTISIFFGFSDFSKTVNKSNQKSSVPGCARRTTSCEAKGPPWPRTSWGKGGGSPAAAECCCWKRFLAVSFGCKKWVPKNGFQKWLQKMHIPRFNCCKTINMINTVYDMIYDAFFFWKPQKHPS